MPDLIKTKTGKKLHLAKGSYIYCGIMPDIMDVSVVTGDVRAYEICDRCKRGMDPQQMGIVNVVFIGA